MFGREELEQLRLQKQALVLESGLHRHMLQADFYKLRSSLPTLSNAARAPRRFLPLLVVLAPLAGFFMVRKLRAPTSLFKRLLTMAKWIGPAYSLWRTYSSARKQEPQPSTP
jgi:hypothetical protein